MKLIASAIKVGDKVYTGRRHFNIFNDAEKHGISRQEMSKGIQGFVHLNEDEDDYVFLDRKEAKALAISTGQVKESEMISTTLTSEDLW